MKLLFKLHLKIKSKKIFLLFSYHYFHSTNMNSLTIFFYIYFLIIRFTHFADYKSINKISIKEKIIPDLKGQSKLLQISFI